jgi:acetyl esterase/lipase
MEKFRLFRYVTSLSLLLLATTLTPAKAALDDGYPNGAAAPGRTCPFEAPGTETVSAFNDKTFVCTVIEGVQKWWIKGDPLPSPAPTSNGNSSGTTTGSTNTAASNRYILPASSLAKMKVFDNVVYATQSPEQRVDIYLPIGVKNPPLMVWTHGGGFVFGDEDGMKFDDEAKMLEVFIKNGIAVASVNYRLAPMAPFPASGQDAKLAIRFLRANAAQYGFNPKKFATGGGSAGAYLALMGAFTANQSSVFDTPTDPNLKTSTAVSAVFDLFGNVNFITMSANKAKYPCTDKTDYAYGTNPYDNSWFGNVQLPSLRPAIDSANLYPFLKGLKVIPRVYIFHGTADCQVTQYDSIELAKEVTKAKGKSYLFLVPGGTHGGPSVMAEARKRIPELAKYFASLK